jgi:hypothetical protein
MRCVKPHTVSASRGRMRAAPGVSDVQFDRAVRGARRVPRRLGPRVLGRVCGDRPTRGGNRDVAGRARADGALRAAGSSPVPGSLRRQRHGFGSDGRGGRGGVPPRAPRGAALDPARHRTRPPAPAAFSVATAAGSRPGAACDPARRERSRTPRRSTGRPSPTPTIARPSQRSTSRRPPSCRARSRASRRTR